MSTETETRATLSVPDPSPETSMSLGKEWTGTDWNNAGLCVNTNGRIWLDAAGGASQSTLSALSNDTSGQLLMQSLKSNLFLMSNNATTVTASKSVLLAGANSIRLFSAHGTTGVFSGFSEKVLSGEAASWINNAFGGDKTYEWVDDDSIGSNYFDRIGPDDSVANSNTASAYIDHTEDISQYWSIGILAQTVWTVAMELGFKVKGVVGGGGKGAVVALTSQIAALTAWLGIRAVAGIISEPGPAGLDMYTIGAVGWATPGFTSLYSLSGMLLTSGFSVGGLGLVSASLNGGFGAVMKSPWRIGMDGKAAEAIAGTDLMLDAKKELNLMGKNVNVGAVGGEAMTQVPTVSIDALSIKDLNVISPLKISQSSAGSAKYSAPTIEVKGTTQIVLKSPGYEIQISVAGVKIAVAKTTKIAMSTGGTVVDCAGGMKLEVGANDLKVGGAAANFSGDATGAWTWTGPITTFI